MSSTVHSDFQALSLALQSSIRKIIEKQRCTQYEMTIKDLNTRGDNFFGKLYEIKIKCITAECEKDINLFVKEKIIYENLNTVNVEQIYANEEFVYKDLAKIITHLQDRANVPPEEKFKIAKAYDETTSDVIILENLRQKGFKIYDKAEPVSLKFFELGVQELAKLHALSFVIENELPEYFKKKLAVLENPLNFNEVWNGVIRNTCRYIADLYDDETKLKIENFLPVALEKLPKYYKDKTYVCTLSHGDYKKNNIMVRIVDGEPVEIVPVDYQLLDYGCPMRDLLYFIFTTSDQDFRKKHLNDLKELYFETLSRFLKYFDLNVETLYPREEFEKIYTEWLDYGLMITLAFSLVIFSPDTGVELDNQSLIENPFRPDKKFDHILRGLIDDFVQWGYL